MQSVVVDGTKLELGFPDYHAVPGVSNNPVFSMLSSYGRLRGLSIIISAYQAVCRKNRRKNEGENERKNSTYLNSRETCLHVICLMLQCFCCREKDINQALLFPKELSISMHTYNEDYQEFYQMCVADGFFSQKNVKIDAPLYKYRRNNLHALDEIKNQYVYTTSVYTQNDPFDSCYRLSYEEALQRKERFDYYFNSFHTLPFYPDYEIIKEFCFPYFNTDVTLERFASILCDAAKETGFTRTPETVSKTIYEKYYKIIPRRSNWAISCFSEKWNSLPMWAYYADNHRGICFKYDFSILDPQEIYTKCILNSLHKVWYSNNKPLDPNAEYSVLVKAQEWAHEQEWRLINWTGDAKVSLPCMTEIYLGIDFPIDSLDSIVDAIKESKRDIKLVYCRPNLQKYRIDLLRLRI